MNNVLRKISSTTFGIFMGRSAEQPQRSPLWVRLLHMLHTRLVRPVMMRWYPSLQQYLLKSFQNV